MSIKPAPYNAIDFTSSFARESKFFDAKLQRTRNIFSSTTNSDGCFLSFEFVPTGAMPDDPPAATLTGTFQDGTGFTKPNYARVVELTDRYIYFFALEIDVPKAGLWRFVVQVTGYTDICQSEECLMVLEANLTANNIVEIIAYNGDETHGYMTSDYAACGFFEVSELGNKIHGVDKVEYSYSYGRKKILSAENFIKTRFIFMKLSMYRQNLLKWLCNCEVLTINGTIYQLISDFTERNKDDLNEVCDLQAEFIEVNQSFFVRGSTERASAIMPNNLFMR